MYIYMCVCVYSLCVRRNKLYIYITVYMYIERDLHLHTRNPQLSQGSLTITMPPWTTRPSDFVICFPYLLMRPKTLPRTSEVHWRVRARCTKRAQCALFVLLSVGGRGVARSYFTRHNEAMFVVTALTPRLKDSGSSVCRTTQENQKTSSI